MTTCEAPVGLCSCCYALKGFLENHSSCCKGMAHLLAEPACSETLLPCSTWLLKKKIIQRKCHKLSSKFQFLSMDENITMIDVERDLWCFNVGTVVPSGTKLRQWKACREYGFVSAGQTELDVLYAKKLKAKDVICAYESGTGFIAIGKVLKYPLPITQFKLLDHRTLRNLPYVNMGTINDHGLFENEGNDEICEHVALIQWYELTAEPLKINKNDYGYYAPRNTTAFLKERNGPDQNFKRDAIEVIKNHFKVRFNFF